MEYDKKACKFIIETLNQKETQDKVLKVELKKKFNIGEKERILMMSMLIQSGSVEVVQKGEEIVYSISKKINLKKRNTIENTKSNRKLK